MANKEKVNPNPGEAAKASDVPSLRLEWLDPADLAENPANWRTHPPAQKAALKDAIAEVGWAGALLYNERTKRLIDGHARREEYAGKKVPVLIGSWDEATEKKILATLDPLSAMAEMSAEKLDALLREIDTGSEALQSMLSDLAGLGGELVEGWGETPENKSDKPSNVVAMLAINVGDVAEFEAAIASVAVHGESPIETIRRGLHGLNT